MSARKVMLRADGISSSIRVPSTADTLCLAVTQHTEATLWLLSGEEGMDSHRY